MTIHEGMPPAQEKHKKDSERSENFNDLYANYVTFEATAFDLQAIFGSLQSGQDGQPIIHQHTRMTLPWPQAKIAAFHLAMNIIAYEEQNGPIQIPQSILPMIAGLNAKARSDMRIMTAFHVIMAESNPELFATPAPHESPTRSDSEETPQAGG